MSDVREYSTRVTPLLAAEPVAHHPLATALHGVLRAPVVGQNPADLWALAVAGDAVVGAVVHRPPGPAHVGLMGDGAAEALVGLLATVRPDLPGVDGPQPTVDGFVSRWEEQAYRRPVLERAAGVWVLAADALAKADTAGAARPAGGDDLPLLRDWGVADHREGALLWEAGGRPVAMAAVSAPVYGVAGINYVYTPPELRRQGYGRAALAAASRHALDAGAERCLAYSDEAMPATGSLYAEVGYRRAGELRRHLLVPSATDRPAGLSMTGTTTAAPRHPV